MDRQQPADRVAPAPRPSSCRGARLRRPERPTPLRIGITIALAAALLAVGGVGFVGRWTYRWADAGVAWSQTSTGPRVDAVAAGGAGEEAGLAPGDRLLSLDGRPVLSDLEAADILYRAPAGAPVAVVVERAGERRAALLVPRPGAQDLYLYAYLSLVGLLSLVLGTTLVLRMPLGPLRLPYHLLSLATFVLLVFSHSGRGDRVDWAIYWGDVTARALLVPVFLHFTWRFAYPRGSAGRRLALAAIYAPAGLLLGLDLWMVRLGGVHRYADPLAALLARDRIQFAYLAVGIAVGIVILGTAYLRAVSDRARRPLKWLFWGGAAGMGPFICLYLVPAALGTSPPAWTELSALPLLLVPLSFAAAVARYRLTDLELFFKRGLAIGALAASAVALYLGALILFRRLLPAEGSGLPEVLAVFLAAVLLPRLRGLLDAAVDRIFYQDRYDHRRSLQEFGRELNRERELRPLATKLTERVSRTLGVDRVVLLAAAGEDGVLRPVAGTADPRQPLALDEKAPLARALARTGSLDLEDLRDPRAEATPSQQFEDADLRYLVPLTVQSRLVGLLALGERRDGGPLNSEDRELLEVVGRHAATAVEGARLFEEMEHRARQIEALKDLSEGILEASQMGVLVLDEAGRITAWNRALTSLRGVDRQDAVGRRMDEVLPESFCDALAAALSSADLAGRRLFRQRLTRPGDHDRVVNVGISFLFLPHGEQRRVVTLDEITEDVRREEILTQQERLASIGLLASGVAHEVNTPLTGISSYAQLLLEETPPDDPRYPLLRKIEQQSFRAADIAKGLLNFSRPTRQGFQPLDLNGLVEETLALFEPQIRGCRIFLRRELTDGSPAVRGDRGRLQQVVLNLLLNARDAMPQGGEIRVRTSSLGDQAVVEVADSGEGIRPEDLPRIYDPFFTTKGPGRGTGLGLSIAYGIVQEHSGSIGVDSRPGEGSRFRVILPALRRARSATP